MEKTNNSEIFNKALSRMVKNFAYEGEIIAKFNKRKPVSLITKELTFSVSEETIVKIIWDYLIEKNLILLHDPESLKNKQYDIERKVDKYGKVSFEKVYRDQSIDKNNYTEINIKSVRDNNIKNSFDNFTKELIDKLPWDDENYYVHRNLFLKEKTNKF